MPLSAIVGFAFLLTSLAFRRATINRHIRGRLLLSASLFAAYTLAAGGLYWFSVPDDTRQTLQAINPLLLAFAVINLIVTLSINPWRVDRVPEKSADRAVLAAVVAVVQRELPLRQTDRIARIARSSG